MSPLPEFRQTFSILLSRIRLALLYSVVVQGTFEFTSVYRTEDVLLISFFGHFLSEVCLAIAEAKKENWLSGRWGFVIYLLHIFSRQAIFVIAESLGQFFVTNEAYDDESTLLLICTTCLFIVVTCLLPDWFLRCDEKGSLKSIMLFSICSRFSIVRFPGLEDGIGFLVYGGSYLIISIAMEMYERKMSNFRMQLLSAAALVFSNLFFDNFIPVGHGDVISFIGLVSMYIITASYNIFKPVESFCLWKCSAEIRDWILTIFPNLQTTEIVLVLLMATAMSYTIKIERLQTLATMSFIQVSITAVLSISRANESLLSSLLSILLLIIVDILLIDSRKKIK